MLKYTVLRALQTAPVILVIVCFNFVLVRLAPGDPITYMIGDAAVDDAYVSALREKYGLDRSIPEQLLLYLRQLAQGDLGYSYVSRENVADVLAARLPASFLLLATQFLLATIIGIVLGVFSSVRRGKAADQFVTVLSLVGFAVPTFWLAQILVLIFAAWLNLLPAQGMYSLRNNLTGFDAVLDSARHLILPALTLTIYNLALIARVARASMINALGLEFITFARSKGVGERQVVWTHALRNAILPVITVIGLNFRTLIAGAVLTETVFAWPGIGRLTYESLISRDYPVLMGILMLIGLTVVIGNILVDLAYTWLDPRIRY